MSKIIDFGTWQLNKNYNIPSSATVEDIKLYALYVRDFTLEFAADHAETKNHTINTYPPLTIQIVNTYSILSLKNSDDLQI